MRPLAACLALLVLALPLAGCASPFTAYSTFSGPEVSAKFAVRPYDSDGDNLTDGIALTLLSASPPPPLVGSDVQITRNGDANVTVWQCPQRDQRLCLSNRGILSWDTSQTVYIRGVPGINRLNVAVRERFVYNTTVRVDELRDTEVWAVFSCPPPPPPPGGTEQRCEYDSNGNGTLDGIRIGLVNSDKAPFAASEVKVLLNKVEVPVFTDPRRLVPFTGQWNVGTPLFVKGYIGQDHLEVVVKATRFDLGTYLIGE
jgi:hypothetical protein